MFRPVVSILLILQLLVSPGWCFAHCHPEHSAEESHQHATRPHLHVGDHGHDHGHSHHGHSHHGHSHHGRNHHSHRGHDQHRSPASSQQESGETPLSATDVKPTLHPTNNAGDTHDSTAVYLAVDAVCLAASPAEPKALSASALFSPLDGHRLTPLPARCATGHAAALRMAHADCPLYLRKLSLRL